MKPKRIDAAYGWAVIDSGDFHAFFYDREDADDEASTRFFSSDGIAVVPAIINAAGLSWSTEASVTEHGQLLALMEEWT